VSQRGVTAASQRGRTTPQPSTAAAGAELASVDDISVAASGASNLGPTNEDLLATVEERIAEYRDVNGLADDALMPVDAVTASGSGVDPQISVANARLQAPRVAEERGLEVAEVERLIDDHTSSRPLGVLGEKGVNALQLNLALDDLAG
jgi:potassium-transporting ATPase KdpC subunit